MFQTKVVWLEGGIRWCHWFDLEKLFESHVDFIFFFFGNSGEILYGYPRSRGRGKGYVGLPVGVPTKTLEVAFRAMEGQAGTRNSRLHYFGIPGCCSCPRLRPGDLGPPGLQGVSIPRGGTFICPPHLLPNCGQTGPRRPPTFLEDLSQTTVGSRPRWSGPERNAVGRFCKRPREFLARGRGGISRG